jgi:hypothetical protein
MPMRPFVNVSVHEFEAALTPAELRIFQIIQGALGAGIAVFLGVTIILYVLGSDALAGEATQGIQLVRMLSLVHLAMAVVLFVAAKVVYDLLFRSERLAAASSPELRNAHGEVTHDPAQHCVALLRTSTIIRLALYEAIALFGLIVCLLAVVDGVVQAYPVYWLNALSSVAFSGYVVLTFPTAERLKALFLSRIKQAAA